MSHNVTESAGQSQFGGKGMGFTKLDENILQSSVMMEDPNTFKVFITLLAACRGSSVAKLSPVYLSSVCRMPLEEVIRAIARLESPDAMSRSTNDEGRRIRRVDGGYEVINYQKYRAYTYSDSPEALRQRQKRERDAALHVTKSRDISVSVSDSVSVSSPESEQKGKAEKITTWRTSFEVYQREELEAYMWLCSSEEWIAERKKYHRGMDIMMTIQKAHLDFWSTPAGWKNKKQSRAKTIDWTATYNNALTMRSNQVWLPRDQQQPSLEDRCRAAGIPV